MMNISSTSYDTNKYKMNIKVYFVNNSDTCREKQ